MELLLNGSVYCKIPMDRDLRQGDPLSPFLFIIVSKLLSRLLHKWEREGKFNGVKLGRSSLSISHLLFADDVLIFCRANTREIRNVLKCLGLYCRWSGQAINFDKSGCFFSRNVMGQTKAQIKSYFQMKEVDKKMKYFGTPLFMARNKMSASEDLRKKIETIIEGWKAKLLLQAGKATLIKHVATSVPVYSMSTFLLSKAWCDNMEKLNRSFLWRNNTSLSRGFTPVAWRKVCLPKRCGDLGIRRLQSFNKALVAKFGWSIMTEEDKLWVKAIKAKYFPYTTFMKKF